MSDGFRALVNATDALRALSRTATRIGNRELPNRQLAVQLQGHVFKEFDTSGVFMGGAWPPLSPRRLAWKIKRNYSSRPLLMTGALRNSYLSFHDANQAGVRSRMSYAEAHELGVPSRNLPQRSVLPSEQEALDYAVRIYSRYIERITT